MGDFISTQPLVTAGCVGLLGVLGVGLSQLIKGDSQMSNKLMRARVLGQGAVVGLVVAVPVYAFIKHKLYPETAGAAKRYDESKY